MQLCVLARHGESDYNVRGCLNGDPAVDVNLSSRGRAEARELGVYLAQTSFDVCVHTRFQRTRQTAQLALELSDTAGPLTCEPRLDDINVGDFEGQPAHDYQAWKADHARDEPLPGGESIRDAARRYAAALKSLAERPEELVLVVCHELPLRYAVNAALGSDDIAGPERHIANAVPYLFRPEALHRASERIRAQADGTWGRVRPAVAGT